MHDTNNLAATIQEILAGIQTHSPSRESQMLSYWEQHIPEKIQQHTKVLKITHQTLFVLVDTASWLYEINTWYARDLLTSIQKQFGKDNIQKIIFMIGDIGE